MRLPFELYGDLLPVPYLAHGRTLQGLDCVGVFMEVQRRLGHALPFYESDPATLESVLPRWEKVDVPQPGDGILIRSSAPDWHVATVISPFEMVHGKEGAGVVVERFDSPAYARRIEGFYRWKE